MRPLMTILLLAGLAACQSAPRPKPSSPQAAAETAIRGQATYLERIRLADGARLEVLLIDDAGATVARGSFEGLRGPPYEFALPYEAAKIDPAHRYALRAALRSAGGHLEFATDARVPVEPGRTPRVELRLVHATTPATSH